MFSIVVFKSSISLSCRACCSSNFSSKDLLVCFTMKSIRFWFAAEISLKGDKSDVCSGFLSGVLSVVLSC